MIEKLPVAFLAGLLSVVTPCVLPLVPGYLSAVSAVEVERLGEFALFHALATLQSHQHRPLRPRCPQLARPRVGERAQHPCDIVQRKPDFALV